MSTAWLVVLVVGAATVLLKAAGPVFLGGRALPARAVALVEVLAPAMAEGTPALALDRRRRHHLRD